mmetsp:Transcript_9322/g.12907  ORF Transcript_9322/g.12907 Transcript_9322/m.12907 type:complete len:86 (-) Transcript_9322:1057-1314(-)
MRGGKKATWRTEKLSLIRKKDLAKILFKKKKGGINHSSKKMSVQARVRLCHEKKSKKIKEKKQALQMDEKEEKDNTKYRLCFFFK